MADVAQDREWSVIYPNGVRVPCESEADALAVESVSSGKAQWRTSWLDADEASHMSIHRDTPPNHIGRAYAADHEAMLALAEPEPEPFRQVRPVAEDIERWQAWHDRRLAALAHARRLPHHERTKR